MGITTEASNGPSKHSDGPAQSSEIFAFARCLGASALHVSRAVHARRVSVAYPMLQTRCALCGDGAWSTSFSVADFGQPQVRGNRVYGFSIRDARGRRHPGNS